MLPGLVPVGAVIAWCKSLTGVPAASDDYAECNGQTLNDPQSVYHNVPLPALNSTTTPRFLRGASTSGGTGGAASHSHSRGAETSFVNGLTGPPCYFYPQPAYKMTESPVDPPYYAVVFMLRIK